MPEEEYEVEATIKKLRYDNVEAKERVDTLLELVFPLNGEERKETIRVYGAFRFQPKTDVKLRYVLGEERLPGSLWKKTPYIEIREIECPEFPISFTQRIYLEK